MLKLTPTQIQDLAHLAYISDREIRSDLVIGMIKDEDDYTSNFTGALRRNINCYSKTGIKATSYALPSAIEQAVGCDATIIIQANGYTKVALFEAKWPRFSKKYYAWDYNQTSKGLSHYSDQLDRQSLQASNFAIFEMFYCEYPFNTQPSHMQGEGSSCVWHHDAINYKNARANPDAIWIHADLDGLLQKGNLSIAEILIEVCSCNQGTPIAKGDASNTIQEFRMSGNILVLEFKDDYEDEI